jgi:hypothetical protein
MLRILLDSTPSLALPLEGEGWGEGETLMDA